MTKATLLTAIAKQGAISTADAVRVLDLYLSKEIRAVKVNAHDGYMIRHCAFLDGDVIRHSLATMEH